MVRKPRHCAVCGKPISLKKLRRNPRQQWCSRDCYDRVRRRRLENESDLERGMFCPNERQIAFLTAVIREGWDERTRAERQGYHPLPSVEVRYAPKVYSTAVDRR
jgi:predicted nucleic acid-binding Zn ribbon protein